METLARTVLDGLTTGAMYGLLALGVVLVHRGTKVINFAIPALGSIGRYIVQVLHLEQGVSWWAGAIVAILVGAIVFSIRRAAGAEADGRQPEAHDHG